MVNFNKFVAIFVVIFTQNTTGDFHQIYQQSESIFISESYFQNTIQNDSDKQGGENAQRLRDRQGVIRPSRSREDRMRETKMAVSLVMPTLNTRE